MLQRFGLLCGVLEAGVATGTRSTVTTKGRKQVL